MTFDLLLVNGHVFTTGGLVHTSLGIVDGRIAAIGETGPAARTLDCTGLTILPGAIDTQVHFREPGLTHKEDLETGSRAAVLGGISGVFEMPNTNPSTNSAAAIADKLARAKGRMWCDHAFYVGATHDNADELAALEMLPGVAGVKIFMGASTGSLLVADDAGLLRALGSGRRRVAIHAEDEERLAERAHLRVGGDPASHPMWRDDESALRATKRAIAAARATGRRVHILHISNPAELAFLKDHKDIASAEATPQHLTLAGEEAYPALGTHAQMNPPIRSAAHREGLWHWLGQGVVDIVGSDHAPHTVDEKAKPYPASPSGMPGTQTLLPIMLDHVAAGRLTLGRLVDLVSAGPARLFGITGHGRIAVGYAASLSVVDTARHWTIEPSLLASRCGWSPFAGRAVTGAPIGTIVRGEVVMWDGALEGAAAGQPYHFDETNPHERT